MISFTCIQCKLGAKDKGVYFLKQTIEDRQKYLPDWNAGRAKPAFRSRLGKRKA